MTEYSEPMMNTCCKGDQTEQGSSFQHIAVQQPNIDIVPGKFNINNLFTM